MLTNLRSMPANRRIWVGAGLLLLLFAGLYLSTRAGQGARADTKPSLMLMSSIPLQWGEAGIADIAKDGAQPSQLFSHLSANNELAVIDDFQKLGEPGATPLLLVQPRALAPRELVELDGWIRKGGNAIIFADPALDWPSELPLGDQRRPLFTSLLTPMFAHWGLELALPVDENSAVAKGANAGKFRLSPKSAGIWLKGKGNPSAACAIRQDQLVAYCTVGKGRALLVADADLLQEAQWTDGLISAGTKAWLDAVIKASRLRDSLPQSLWESEGV
jgi:hypothetical protein